MSEKIGQTGNGSTMSSAGAPGSVAQPGERIWIAVFIFSFLGMVADGMALMFLSYSLPSLMAELGFSKVEAGALASYSLLGMAIGGFVGGWFADRYGRVRTVVWTIIIFSVGTAFLCLTQNYWQFAVLRFISSLGLGAVYVVCNTLMSEYVPTSRRTTVLGALQAGWSVGYVVATVLAGLIIPVYGWRFLFATGIVPVVFAVLMRRIVPEPASWVESKKLAAALAAAKDQKTKEKNQWQVIFENRGYRKSFILWTLVSGFLQFGYYGVNNWLPTYVVNELHFDFRKMTGYLVGTYVAMILGKIIAGYTADLFGRRWIYAFGGVATALFMPIIVYYHSPGTIVPLLVFFGFLYGVPYGVAATYMTESFATSIRGTAVGGSYNLGRVGAAIAPTAIGLIAMHYSIGAGLIVMGGAYFLTGIIPALFIKEKMYDPQKAV